MIIEMANQKTGSSQNGKGAVAFSFQLLMHYLWSPNKVGALCSQNS